MTEYKQVMKLQKMYVSMDNIDPPSVLAVILSVKLNQNVIPLKLDIHRSVGGLAHDHTHIAAISIACSHQLYVKFEVV